MNIAEGIRWGEAALLAEEIENARFDTDMLLAGVLAVARERLYIDSDRCLSGEQESVYRNWILRRAGHEPLQYILREQGFMGLSFYVDERVLIPRPDSEVLVEKWLELVRASKEDTETAEEKDFLKEKRNCQKEKRAAILTADLCTGSGALALAMAHYCPEVKVVGTDLSAAALAVAEINARRLGVSVEWRQGDLAEPIHGETWDYIVVNPPYIAEEEYTRCQPEVFFEPGMALRGGRDGLDFYRRLAEERRTLLKPQGKILMEIGWDQAEAVCGLFEKNGFQTQVFADLGGRDRVVLAR